MKAIKVMTDYHCWPLWHNGTDEIGNIDPYDLPISQALADDLNAWAWEYDATLNMDYPPDSGFPTPEAELDFKWRGAVLADRLRVELGSEFSIEYHDKYS